MIDLLTELQTALLSLKGIYPNDVIFRQYLH